MTGLAFAAAFVAFLIGACAYLPFGILAWLWLALQSPHQVVGVDFQFNLAIVVACLIGIMTNRRKPDIWFDGTLAMMTLLLLHSGITTLLAYNPEFSYPYFDRLWKTMLLAGFVAIFMQTRTRLQAVVWVMAISIAALAVKGAVFSILTAGQFRVFGPPGSQITDNNLFAGAICIAIPFVVYLVSTSAQALTKLAARSFALLMPLTVLFTYSRGGLLTLLSVGGCYFLQSRRKLPITIAVVVLGLFALPLMPSKWLERMQTITETIQDTGKADESVQGRFNAWYVYSRIAMDRPLIGGGFRAPEVFSVWQIHLPNSTRAEGAKAAHNNIFQVLGEHGFLGLFIYLLIILLAFKNVASIIARTRHVPELDWARQLAVACGIALVAYNVAGLTVSLPYYDYFIVLVVVIAGLRRLVMKILGERQQARAALHSDHLIHQPGPHGQPAVGRQAMTHGSRG